MGRLRTHVCEDRWLVILPLWLGPSIARRALLLATAVHHLATLRGLDQLTLIH